MNKEYALTFLEEIINIDSPSGFTKKLVERLAQEADALGYAWELNEKGNIIIDVPGQSDEKTIGLSAHGDTLGLMVRSISPTGTLNITTVGGPTLPTLDGEYCKIYTRDGQVYEGTILSKSAATHVFEDTTTRPRDEKNMEVKIDELVYTKEDVEKLGIMAGDYICFVPKFQITESGFIKSRFLDDKLSVAVLFAILKQLKEENKKPVYHTKIFITTYEETGHGLSHVPKEVSELLAVDMGCIGDDLSCTEKDVSICVKDSSGPYDYEMTSKLINLAKEHKVDFAVDIYPRYGSDASAALRGGNNIKAALIGAGVANSHGMERAHINGMMGTMKLVYEYMLGR